MNRQHALIWISAIFAVAFTIALIDGFNKSTWDCGFNCLHLHGKIAFVITSLCVLGVILVGLTRKKR